MPDEEKTETAVEETSVDNLIDKASKLKKAGLSTAAVILIAAMGFPGFWEFFRGEGAEAKVRAEVSYQLLKVQTEALVAQNTEIRADMNELRNVINSMLLQRPVVGITTRSLPEVVPAPRISPLPDTIGQADDTASGKAAMAAAGVNPSMEL